MHRHAPPTIAQSNQGNILAAWVGGSFDGAKDTQIWFSISSKEKWSSPAPADLPLHATEKLEPTWNPVLVYHPERLQWWLFIKMGDHPRNTAPIQMIAVNTGLSHGPQRCLIQTRPAINLQQGGYLLVYNQKGRNRLSIAYSQDTYNWQTLKQWHSESTSMAYPTLIETLPGQIKMLMSVNRRAIGYVGFTIGAADAKQLSQESFSEGLYYV